MQLRFTAGLAGWAVSMSVLAGAGLAQQGDTQPLSAIDWLSQTVQTPASAQGAVSVTEPPVAQTAETPQISVTYSYCSSVTNVRCT